MSKDNSKKVIERAMQDLEKKSPWSLLFTNNRSKLCSVFVINDGDDYKYKINGEDISWDVLVKTLKDGGFKLRGVDNIAVSNKNFPLFVEKLENSGVDVSSRLSISKITELIKSRQENSKGISVSKGRGLGV